MYTDLEIVKETCQFQVLLVYFLQLCFMYTTHSTCSLQIITGQQITYLSFD